MVEKSPFGFLESLNTSTNAWWQNPGCSFNQVNFCGLFDGSVPNTMTEVCDKCNSKFFFLKRKHRCHNCGLLFCGNCTRRLTGGLRKCQKCDIFSQWPVDKDQVTSLRVRDLRFFLNSRGITTDTCTEKRDLVDLVVSQIRLQYHKANEGYRVNIPSYSRSTQNYNQSGDDGIRVKPIRVTPADQNTTCSLNEDLSGIRVFPSPQDQSSPPQDNASNFIDLTNDTDTSTSSSWSMLNESNSDSPSESMPVSDSNQEEVASPAQATAFIPSHPTTPEGAEALSSDTPAEEEAEVIPPPSLPKAQEGLLANIVKLSSLTGEDSIKSLSVRQCKEILSLHRVDYSGVWEKHELVSKVMLLWEDFKKMNSEIDNLPEDQLCKICMAAPMNCVLLECGHMVSCTLCGKQMAECPICRQNVIRIVRTFRA